MGSIVRPLEIWRKYALGLVDLGEDDFWSPEARAHILQATMVGLTLTAAITWAVLYLHYPSATFGAFLGVPCFVVPAILSVALKTLCGYAALKGISAACHLGLRCLVLRVRLRDYAAASMLAYSALLPIVGVFHAEIAYEAVEIFKDEGNPDRWYAGWAVEWLLGCSQASLPSCARSWLLFALGMAAFAHFVLRALPAAIVTLSMEGSSSPLWRRLVATASVVLGIAGGEILARVMGLSRLFWLFLGGLE